MDFEEFEPYLDAAVARHQALGLPDEMSPFDNIRASEVEIRRVERDLEVQLPEQYKEFMSRYGGGSCASVYLLPVISKGGAERDLLDVNRTESFTTPFLAVAPVGTGDWWGFEVTQGACRDQVSIYSFEDEVVESESTDFLSFVAKQGLRIEGA